MPAGEGHDSGCDPRSAPRGLLTAAMGVMVLLIGLTERGPRFYGLMLIVLVTVIAASVSLHRRRPAGPVRGTGTWPLVVLILMPIVAGCCAGTGAAVVVTPTAAALAAGVTWWALRPRPDTTPAGADDPSA